MLRVTSCVVYNCMISRWTVTQWRTIMKPAAAAPAPNVQAHSMHARERHFHGVAELACCALWLSVLGLYGVSKSDGYVH